MTSKDAAVDIRVALIAVTAIFFMWGFITELNDVLIPHLKSVFELKYWQAMLVQFCFFGAYLVMAVAGGTAGRAYRLQAGYRDRPAGGWRRGVADLAGSADGCLWTVPVRLVRACQWHRDAAGLGQPLCESAWCPRARASRLNFAQAINSVGHTIGPWVGGALILGATHLSTQQLEMLPAAERAQTVAALYLGVALALGRRWRLP